jgi:MoxR-like ATPase
MQNSQVMEESDEKLDLSVLGDLRKSIGRRVIGQTEVIDRMLIGLLVGGHLLLEGAPGLAKTTAVRAIADCIDADFHRIQFTPDLLPGDLIGTEVFRPETASFEFVRGPLFHSILLTDEINRAPAKVQSALLEAMQERQVTVGHTTYPLPELFWVIATQNPIENEGTFPLPEAQIDRFIMMIRLDYPNRDDELEILKLHEESEQEAHLDPVIHPDDLFVLRRNLRKVYMAPELKGYIVDLVASTREPARYDPELEGMVVLGASPRATIALSLCARAHAAIHGRDFVSPHDIQNIAIDVLQHRIVLSFEGMASRWDRVRMIQRLIEVVPVP